MRRQRERATRATGGVLLGVAAVILLGCGGGDPVSSGTHRNAPPSMSAAGSSASAGGSGGAAGSGDSFGNAPMSSDQAGSDAPVVMNGDECAEGVADTLPITPTVWLVLDGSSSMNMPFEAAATRWQTLRSTLMDPGGVVESLQSVVRFGMVIYSGGVDMTQCVNLVTVDPALDNYATLDAMYPADPIGTGTPTDKAVEHVVTNLPVLNDPNGVLDMNVEPIYVVLATDGAPNDSCSGMLGGGGPSGGDPVVMQRVIDVVTNGTSMGMQMYVISLAGEDQQLQDHLVNVAAATSSMTPPFVPSTRADLISTFQSITSGATCQISLNGMVKEGMECSGKVRLNGELLECNAADGWMLLDPSTIQLTGAACDTFLSKMSLVEASFPCGVFVL